VPAVGTDSYFRPRAVARENTLGRRGDTARTGACSNSSLRNPALVGPSMRGSKRTNTSGAVRTSVALGAVAALLPGCVVVPRTTTSYDRECQVVSKRVELEAVQVAQLGSCRNADCGVLLAVVGITAVGSAVISGSIAIVGNVAFWLERQGQCVRTGAPPILEKTAVVQ